MDSNTSRENDRREPADDRPNIIIILVDDMGYSDIGCYGSEIATPHLDALASQGVQFAQMYNCARCCPSRASLLTGLYPHQTGIGHMTPPINHPNYQGYLNDRCVTIAEVLRSNGYQTLMSGKWHVGGKYDLSRPDSWKAGDERHPIPLQRGFDRFYGTLEGCASYFRPHTLMMDDRLIDVDEEDYYYTDAITDRAVSMIDEYGTGQSPFFLYVAYTAPHWPLHALPEDIAKYRGKYGRGWDQVREERHERLIEEGILDEKWKISTRHRGAPPWEEIRHKEWEDCRMAVYAAQIDRMDQGVGRIMGKLESLAIKENTLVMFLSDNGGCAEYLGEEGHMRTQIWPMRDGSYPQLGNTPDLTPGGEETYMSYDVPWANASNSPFRLFKHWVHEGGISTPLVVSWPAVIKKHRIIQSISHVIDIMATCIDVSGAEYPETFNGAEIHRLQGESLLQALKGERWSRERPLFWEHEGNCAVRTQDWKLVRRYPENWELYNMEQDRTEQTDLVEENREKAQELEKMHVDFCERCGVVPWDRIKTEAPYDDHAGEPEYLLQ
jgi:arylsulfatase